MILPVALAAVLIVLCCAGLCWHLAQGSLFPQDPAQADTEPLPVLARIESYSDEAWGTRDTITWRRPSL